MKLIHLSDLHLGKRVNEFSMIEDQKFILDEILMEFFLREIFMTGRFLLQRPCSFLTVFSLGWRSGNFRFMPSAEIMTAQRGLLLEHIL